ncbi:MAG: DUF4272 domain-containing protein [Myxococcota bacterium]|nr:DUF4272 domain-containing protein [Myxococcota bacterium]
MSHPVNLYSSLWEPPVLDFPHTLLGHRDSQDPDLAEHLEGFAGYLTQKGTRPMTAPLWATLEHLQKVQHHVSVQVDADALEEMSDWAMRANALIFLTDGSVRDPSGLVLVSAQGASHPQAQVPHPPDAWARKSINEDKLKRMGIPFAESLPPVCGAGEVAPRSAQEIAQRAQALLAVALHAEVVHSGDGPSATEICARLPDADFSPAEALFLSEPSPSRQDLVNHLWRYESLRTMLWAIGLQDLPFPTETADAATLSGCILGIGPTTMVQQATLRPETQLLDSLDLHLRLHWAVREAHRSGTPMPADLDGSVILERHTALNWICGWHDADWDQIDTPT